ncbi:hypothetical protein BC936DRAFT_139764 [Jimgerdemannia flammicorona]|uniref:Uncharacterized protein n=1 Tax=Jimgerdemannia flammicorona TaxID=994334 RepID=A0A433B9B1_9FUNG|nr:hypothetical protein BC936DRAFT_139764 [Jimgerdemannia flammicorona]
MKRKQVSSSDAGVGADINAKERAGYNTTHILPRTFHVSPFNDRTGTYTIYTVDPFASPIPHLDVRIVIRNNPDLTLPRDFPVSGTPTKKFMAKAQGDAIPFTPRNVLVTVARFTGDVFATVPRIMWQAGVLHYSKGLRVYPRPEPKVEWGTVGVKKPDGFER